MKDYYKVMIVESKKSMVHIYKNMIPWEEYGFEIFSVTDAEIDAVALYGEYKYDLILTDLNLKSGNGISLIKKLKRLNPSCIVIVIAAQEDYDSVREAFLVGAYDYLLKSRIRYSSLVQILEDVKSKLLDEKHELEEDRWKQELEKSLGLIRDHQKIDEHRLLTLLHTSDFSLLQGAYRMMYFRQDNIRNFNRSMKQYDKPNWINTDEFLDSFRNKISWRDEFQRQFCEIITECITSIPNAVVQFTKKHSCLILLPETPGFDYAQLAQTMISKVNERMTFECSITISECSQGIDSFLSTYQAVMQYHEHKFYDGDKCIECMEDHKLFYPMPKGITCYEEAIVQGVMEQDFAKIEQGYCQGLAFMKEQMIDPKEVKAYFIHVLESIALLFEKKEMQDRYSFDILKDGIEESESIMFLQLELEKMFKTLIDWSKAHHINQYHHKVNVMLDYIEQHISEKIVLEQLVAHADLSVTHASRMFKADVGTSIVDYINQRKMEVAKELLHDSSKKIKEIAQAVGMEDQLYFNKVFKKYYQISPREYRKKL